jgi:hypothetical protein
LVELTNLRGVPELVQHLPLRRPIRGLQIPDQPNRQVRLKNIGRISCISRKACIKQAGIFPPAGRFQDRDSSIGFFEDGKMIRMAPASPGDRLPPWALEPSEKAGSALPPVT